MSNNPSPSPRRQEAADSEAADDYSPSPRGEASNDSAAGPSPRRSKHLEDEDTIKTVWKDKNGIKPKPKTGPLSEIKRYRPKKSAKSGVQPKLRYRQGEGALLDIHNAQQGTDFPIKRLPFSRVVKEISNEVVPRLRWEANAITALQEITGTHLATMFSMTQDVACHAKRVIITVEDMCFLKRLKYKEIYGIGAVDQKGKKKSDGAQVGEEAEGGGAEEVGAEGVGAEEQLENEAEEE